MKSWQGNGYPNGANALPSVCARCLVRGMMEVLPIPLVVTDGDGRILLMNQEAERLLGLREAETLFRSLKNFLSGPGWPQFWEEAMGSSQARRALLAVGSPPRPVEVSVAPFLCSLQGNRGFLFLFTLPAEERWMHHQLLSTLEEWTGEAATVGERPRLSPREQRVLRLLAEGLSNRSIAQRLQISSHTVDTHVRRIYRKLGIHSRAQAAAWVARNLR